MGKLKNKTINNIDWRDDGFEDFLDDEYQVQQWKKKQKRKKQEGHTDDSNEY